MNDHKHLPSLHPDMLAHSAAFTQRLRTQMRAHTIDVGTRSSVVSSAPSPTISTSTNTQTTESNQDSPSIPFEQWMGMVLYTPEWGYYTGGLAKLSGDSPVGQALQGDFTTAPELSPWYGRSLAQQVSQVLQASDSLNILEFGAGSGKLAFDILSELNNPQVKYFILELSADLKQRQAERLAPFGAQVVWLDALPTEFSGCVLANEVLDAMPVTVFEFNQDAHLQELYVRFDAEQEQFTWQTAAANEELNALVQARMPALPSYRSEINRQAESWIRAMGSWLKKGAAILIDYGFPQQEYYHPQRAEGTLMCHLRHHAHADPLVYPGLQDITAHVDFTAMADAAIEGSLEVLGYTSQARFLMNCGILQMLSQLDPEDTLTYAQSVGPVQKLLSEAEMGELFKVLMIGRDLDIDPIGFMLGDRRHSL